MQRQSTISNTSLSHDLASIDRCHEAIQDIEARLQNSELTQSERRALREDLQAEIAHHRQLVQQKITG